MHFHLLGQFLFAYCKLIATIQPCVGILYVYGYICVCLCVLVCIWLYMCVLAYCMYMAIYVCVVYIVCIWLYMCVLAYCMYMVICVQGGTQAISVHDLVCLLLQVCQCAEKVLQKEEGRSYNDSTQQNMTKRELE